MGYCMQIMNYNFMPAMPFLGCNCMPKMQIFPSLFGMFNPIRFTIPSFNTNPWSVFGWQPSVNYNNFMSFQQPVNTNYSLFNQPSNLFTVPLVDCSNFFNNLKKEKKAANFLNNGTPLNLSDAQLTAYGFDTTEKRNGFRQLKPQMQRAVVELSNYAKSQGIKITYASKRSIFRTRSEQEAIYRTARSGYAAKPGSSRHESGEAIDITIPGANKNNKNDPQYRKLAEKWQSMGYTWGGNWKHCEPWHFDLRTV